jgi:hypothetical protein
MKDGTKLRIVHLKEGVQIDQEGHTSLSTRKNEHFGRPGFLSLTIDGSWIVAVKKTHLGELVTYIPRENVKSAEPADQKLKEQAAPEIS